MNDRLYTKHHIWVLINDNIATIGITDFLQEKIGTVMFVNLPQVGNAVIEGEVFGELECNKTVLDIESPVSGKIVDVNLALDDEPEIINSDPYGTWLIKVSLNSTPVGLLHEIEYKKKINAPWLQNH